MPHAARRRTSPAGRPKSRPFPGQSATHARRIPASSGTSVASLLAALYELLQPVHLAFAQDLRLHHAAHQLLHRTLAEAVDDLSHGARRQAPGRFDGAIEVGAAGLLVLEIAFLLEAA